MRLGGRLAGAIEVLEDIEKRKRPVADALKDPWDRPFMLVIPGTKNVDFDIVSYGADGQPGGAGEDADVIKP